MRVLLAAVATLLPSLAWGFATPQPGVWVDVGGGGALSGPPTTASPEWAARVGFWHGPYDDAYAIGRFWGLGAGVRQGLSGGALWTAPTLEVRRGIDILVVKLWAGVAGGPVFGRDGIDATVRATGGLKYRPHRLLGPTLSLDVGADVGERVDAHLALLVGVEWSAPLRPAERPELPMPAPPPSD